jgi:hypothetical protein
MVVSHAERSLLVDELVFQKKRIGDFKVGKTTARKTSW